MRSNRASDACTSIPTDSSAPTGKKMRVWIVAKATNVPTLTAPSPLAIDQPPAQ